MPSGTRIVVESPDLVTARLGALLAPEDIDVITDEQRVQAELVGDVFILFDITLLSWIPQPARVAALRNAKRPGRRMAGAALFGGGSTLTVVASLLFRAADAVRGSKLKAGFFQSEAEARTFLSSLREQRAGTAA